jgi:GT2 family glycosyltransferase/SAM-dependent methyltransferase/glycosyltransferase involved in cell wall biosynthesis
MERLPMPDRDPLSDDGNSFSPRGDADTDQLQLHRYLSVMPFLHDRDVLDIACGEGYGAWVLAASSRRVTAVDIDRPTTSRANTRYASDKLRFLAGEAEAIPLDDASVDCVVAFRPLARIADREGFLKEIRRVLRPNGVLYISIPNPHIHCSSEPPITHHQREFDELLGRHFNHVGYYGQGLMLGSAIWQLDTTSTLAHWHLPALAPDALLDRQVESATLIAAASDGEAAMAEGFYPYDPQPCEIGATASAVSERGAVLRWLKHERAARRASLDSSEGGVGPDRIIRGEQEAALRERAVWLLDQLKTERAVARRREEALRLALRRSRRRPLSQWRRNQQWRFYRFLASAAAALGSKRVERFARQRDKHDPRRVGALPGSPEWISDVRLALQQSPTAAVGADSAIKPTVSVVIPVYNQIADTVSCLLSLVDLEDETLFEVIILDHCSTDATVATLQNVAPWICYRQQNENGGFLRDCRSALAVARGDYVVFLNNDTEVCQGWLDRLIETFAHLPDAGLVGSMLVYPDGSLKESGCILGRDGSASGFGRGDDPDRPEYNYVRQVDCCSSASIMVLKDLLDRLSGLDEHPLPACCDGIDLALQIRAAGYAVYVQPSSRVIHHEGVRSSTDTGSGVKGDEINNTRKLNERRRLSLADRPQNGIAPMDIEDFGLKRRLLVVDAITPEPDHDAGSSVTVELMRSAQALGYTVSFIANSNPARHSKYTTLIQSCGIEAFYSPYCVSLKDHLETFGKRYDSILVFRVTELMDNYDIIRRLAPQARLIFHVADLHHWREEREAALKGDADAARSAALTRKSELTLVEKADVTVVHSHAESEYLLREVPGAKVITFPWIIEPVHPVAPFEERSGMFFLGSYRHRPNVDAVEYFLDEIWPAITKALPRQTFSIVGHGAPETLVRRAHGLVRHVGYVPDLAPIMQESRICVVPLRFGAGVKGKIYQALAHGVPVVCTSLAAEGMSLTEGTNALIADTPEAFAAAAIALHEDPALWVRLSAGGQAYIERTVSREAGERIMRRVLGIA